MTVELQIPKDRPTIMVINAGSSSIKYSLYDASDLTFITKEKIQIDDATDYTEAFHDIIDLIDDYNVVGVGHRVVHGGREYGDPQVFDKHVWRELEALTPLAPLHQPHNLKPVKLIFDEFPDVKQVACFDTAFHRTMPRLSELYAIPRDMTDDGIIRYGFHGSSYEYISSVLAEYAPDDVATGNVIIAHLGNGASMCAIKDGKSVATTMGFTPLDGLMMGTRSGTLDPGLSLYLEEQKGMTAPQISKIFQKESGLKGVSGIDSDMRTLLASNDPAAKEAVDLFCLYAARQAAGLVVDLGGLDALVFTAGIGANAPVIRQKICDYLSFLNVDVDPKFNNENESKVHSYKSSVHVYVIPTDEELMIAQHTKRLVFDNGSPKTLPAPPAP